jgi:hypothetical protein
MSRLSDLLRFVIAWLNTPATPSPMEPDRSPRDWADLPPHHPKADCTPC